MSEYTTVGQGVRSPSPRSVTTGATNLGRLWSSDFVYVSSVALDWLTLTTFDVEAFRWAVSVIQGHTDASASAAAQVLQYRGVKGDGWFVGAGQQKQENDGPLFDHFLVRLSGSVAHSFLRAALNYPRMLSLFKCTRADVQYTHTEVPPFRLEELGQALEAADWSAHKGRKPKLEWFHNADGLDTLYIGSRSSVRLQRIYVKPVDGTNHLRWEVEYKQELAQNLWAALLGAGLDVLPSILAGEMAVVPLAVCPELAVLPELVGAIPARLKLVRDASDDWTAIDWLWRSVLPCVRRLQSKDEKVQRFVRDFLLRAFLGDDGDLPPPVGSLSLDNFINEWEESNYSEREGVMRH